MKMWQKLLLIVIILAGTTQVQAQDQLLILAKEYFSNKDYPKAAELYAKLYENSPNDETIFENYMECLLATKQFKVAEKIIKPLYKKDKKNTTNILLYARFYNAQGENKKAAKLIEQLVEDNSNDDNTLRATALVLSENNYIDNAIAMYEQGRIKSGNAFVYAEELAVLYNKKGDFEKATDGLLDLAVIQSNKLEEVKTALLKLFSQADKVENVRKKIIKRINTEPDNLIYPDILAWLFIQQKDYESAFEQVQALDIRTKDQGYRPLNFARIAAKEKQYTAAYNAYNYIITLGNKAPFYYQAFAEKIATVKKEFEAKPNFTKPDIDSVLQQYQNYITEYPNATYTETIREYAMLQARYANNPAKAIELLNNAIKGPVNNILKGKCKLDLGDYHLVNNNNWEATLLYSQVDKDFKSDALGEEARFRNAKLSYYMGDFAWAQGQLDVLKASTTELIANDALNLSVLITENSALDSIKTPLEIFSRAELLIFQNKIKAATQTLDTIVSIYPDHSLNDDILMAKSNIAIKQHNFEAAATMLQQVFTKHNDDLLADDAMYKYAQIQEQYLNNKEEAKKYYEKIILDYAGSSFVSEARKNYRRLRGDVLEESN